MMQYFLPEKDVGEAFFGTRTLHINLDIIKHFFMAMPSEN